MDNLRKSVLGRTAKRSGLSHNQQDYSPIKWTQYFDDEVKISTNDGIFNVYKKGDSGTIIVCLHGGGYSGLTWALFAVEITNIINCQVVAIDLRGHGNTVTDDDYDLSLETLAHDVVNVITKLYGNSQESIILVGHSMGGAVAVECAHLIASTVGLCVIDVVEGTALDALSSMQSILRGRPLTFKSIQHAIQWCYKGGQTNNIEAAKVSMPGQIVNATTGNLAANECDTIQLKTALEMSTTDVLCPPHTIAEISDESEFDDDDLNDYNASDSSSDIYAKPPLPKAGRTDCLQCDIGPKYKWRIDLSKTEKFWGGWFKGLSEKFLSIRIPKLLLLANIHGLDTALTIGQMQGKFQMQVLAKSGHAIHEDQPHNVAEIIGGYLVKQKIAIGKVELTCPIPGC